MKNNSQGEKITACFLTVKSFLHMVSFQKHMVLPSLAALSNLAGKYDFFSSLLFFPRIETCGRFRLTIRKNPRNIVIQDIGEPVYAIDISR
jgi:hypothetical protein